MMMLRHEDRCLFVVGAALYMLCPSLPQRPTYDVYQVARKPGPNQGGSRARVSLTIKYVPSQPCADTAHATALPILLRVTVRVMRTSLHGQGHLPRTCFQVGRCTPTLRYSLGEHGRYQGFAFAHNILDRAKQVHVRFLHSILKRGLRGKVGRTPNCLVSPVL
jgi:hypothetical protein